MLLHNSIDLKVSERLTYMFRLFTPGASQSSPESSKSLQAISDLLPATVVMCGRVRDDVVVIPVPNYVQVSHASRWFWNESAGRP
jgi:hypothetical protein